MKSFIKFIETGLLTSILTLIVLVVASKIFIPKWTTHDWDMMTFIIKGFYAEKKNSLDVVVMGNSDTYRGIDPIIMYHDYGFTSYDFAATAQRMVTAKAMFDETLRLQNPKVILFNVDEIFLDDQKGMSHRKKVYCNMELSTVKVKVLFDPNFKASITTRLSNFLPILSFHSRYKELNSDDFKYAFYNYHYALKGMDMVATRSTKINFKLNNMVDTGAIAKIPEVNREYLDEMVEECNKRGIKFVLFHTPALDNANYARYKAVKEYADEKNIDYYELNFYIDEIGIDWEADSADGGNHLNMFGAQKTSIYLGKILKEKYNLPDHRGDSNYKIWDEDYKEYLKIRNQEIEDAKKLGTY